MNSTTQLQKQAKMMKREFSTNWYIYRMCQHSIPSNLDLEFKEDSENPEKMLSPQCDHEFNKLVLDAIDESFSSLGKSAKEVIYSYLDETCGIKKSEMPNRIEEVAHSLEQIFGPGAKLIEIQIMKTLYQKIGEAFVYSPKHNDLLFVEYIKAAKLSNDPN